MPATSPSCVLLPDRHRGLTGCVRGSLPIAFGSVGMVGPAMNRLNRSHFLSELSGKVHPTQHVAVFIINPDLARRALAATRVTTSAR